MLRSLSWAPLPSSTSVSAGSNVRRAGHGWSRGVEPLAVVEEEQGGARLVALGRFRRFHVMVPQ